MSGGGIGNHDFYKPGYGPTNMMKYECFKRLLMCTHRDEEHNYFAICWLKFKDRSDNPIDNPSDGLSSPLFENTQYCHAEDHLMRHLKTQLSVTKPEKLESITIMQNTSPCRRCADNYTKILQDFIKDVEVTLVFSSLHCLIRRLCFYKNHQSKWDNTHGSNTEGLLRLRDCGIKLRTTQHKDWVRLSGALQTPCPEDRQYWGDVRSGDDRQLEIDLNGILDGQNGHSRLREASCIFYGPGSPGPTNMMKYKWFERLLMCGWLLRGEEPITHKYYLAIYWLKFRDPSDNPSDNLSDDLSSPLFENTKDWHVEDYLMPHLKSQLSVTKPEKLKSITIMQNASPCSRCSDHYTEKLQDFIKDVKVTLVFSSFHRLTRPSCKDHNHQPVQDNIHESHTKGLRRLRECGIKLRTTQYKDWVRLSGALQTPRREEWQYRGDVRFKEDTILESDLNAILSGQ